jgi:hypothetical protein
MSIDMNAWMGLTMEQEIILVMFWVMPLLPNFLHLEGYAMLCTMNASMQRSYSKCARVLCMTWDKAYFLLLLVFPFGREKHTLNMSLKLIV